MENKFKEFECKICKKYYQSYQSIWNHNKKFHNNIYKSDCKDRSKSKSKHKLQNIDKNEIKCFYCDKTYKHRQSKWKHEKTCEKKESFIHKKLKQENLELKQQINDLLSKSSDNNQITELLPKSVNNQIKKVDGDINTKEMNGNHNTNNNNEIKGDHNTMNSVNITNNFNSDNLSFITPQFFKNLLKETLFEQDFHKVIPKVIEEVKFNLEHKENHNVKLNNSKSKKGEIFINDKWQTVNDVDLIDYLTKRGYQIYEDLSTIHKEQIVKRYIETNDKFKDNYLDGENEQETNKKMKETVIEGTKKITKPKYDREQRRKEIMEEKFIIPPLKEKKRKTKNIVL